MAREQKAVERRDHCFWYLVGVVSRFGVALGIYIHSYRRGATSQSGKACESRYRPCRDAAA